MALEMEIKGYYKAGYYKLLDEVLKVKDKYPDAYDALATVTRNYRDWVLDIAQVDKLPEVPPK